MKHCINEKYSSLTISFMDEKRSQRDYIKGHLKILEIVL